MGFSLPEQIGEKINCLLREEKDKEAEYKFNIFNVAGIATSEVHMCNVLFEFLNPDGAHGQGSAYLETFLNQFFKEDQAFRKPIVTDVSVKLELGTGNKRRIDIVIQDSSRLIPFEVKIFADDQPNQCVAYLEFARAKSSGNTKLFYLTPDKRKPSDESAAKYVRSGDIITISWSDIADWLCNSKEETKSGENEHVRIIRRQFAAAIKKFVLLYEFYKGKEYMKLINESLEIIRTRLKDMKEMDNVHDDGDNITFVIDENEGLFFRVQRDPKRNTIAAGIIAGAKSGGKSGGKWTLSPSNEYRKKIFEDLAEKYGSFDSWWLEMETIVPYVMLYRLYDQDDYLNRCVDRIREYYIRSQKKWKEILAKGQHS